MKKIFVLLIFLLNSLSFSTLASAEETTTDTTADVQIKQNLYLEVPDEDATPEELEELKSMYEAAGWVTEGDYFVKQVHQEAVEVQVEDQTYVTDSNGEIQVPLDQSQDSTELELTVNTSPQEESTYVVEVGSDKTANITQDIYLDEIIAEMGKDVETATDTQAGEEVAPSSQDANVDGAENVGNVSHGTSYSRGQTVHCNRFNGYLGDGVYYDKFDHPYLASRNFVQSDCDVALFWYTYCLSDYGEASKRYCSNYRDTNKGRCSVLSRVGHSRKYHKHTGFFSPSS
ncbi:hypothetical protein [Bacillus sp. UNC438CL73TsuS30]|uniref:hypothetical protein n=1 Tax=Bacillus sp. UNC438CL73TsuS30 TaxID=1340434 RepID=UPI0004792E78|nr:hypothetical protein [Bacillus sp. UNC438CL73TsuS30]